MKLFLEKLLKIMTLIIFICVLIYIVLIISLIFSEKALTVLLPTTEYINSIWQVISTNWIYIIFAALIPVVCNTSYRVYSELAESIRHNRFYAEIDRWLDTPYISPLHHLYMIKPPGWLKIEDFNPFRNQLYKNVTKVFSEIIYFRFAYSNFEPSNKPISWLKVIPTKQKIRFVIEAAIIIIITFTYINIQDLINEFSLFLLLIVFKLLTRTYYRIMAIWEHARWSTCEKSIIGQFGEAEPKIKWVSLYPTTDHGQRILKVWKAESTLRQKRDETFRIHRKANMDRNYDLNKVPRVLGAYDMPNHAPAPYPSEKLPEWIENYEAYNQEQFDNKKNKDYETLKAIVQESHGQIIDFLAAKNKTRSKKST